MRQEQAERDPFEAWGERARANRSLVERVRKQAPDDFYRATADWFRPGAEPPPELDALLEIARPDDTWLDIGAGGGRFALPLAPVVGEVVAIEPSAAMRAALGDAIAARGVGNIRILELRWPPGPGAGVPVADVALAANVLYDQEDARAFIEAIEAHARRSCAVILRERAPSTPDETIWQDLYGEPAAPLPAADDFIGLLSGSGRPHEVRRFEAARSFKLSLNEAHAMARQLYWVRPGSERDEHLRVLIAERYGDHRGMIEYRPAGRAAVITWQPEGTNHHIGSSRL